VAGVEGVWARTTQLAQMEPIRSDTFIFNNVLVLISVLQ
jgi:hypothetical protein